MLVCLRIPFAVVVSVCSVLLFSGCRKNDPEYFGTIQPIHGPDELWINNSNEPEWIDPGKCSDSTGGEVIRNMFAGLCELHPATLEPMPDIAARWELSADAKTYTFHLRDAVWSDGVPVTAHDFAWSWKRVLDPETASKYSIIMYPIKNGDVFNQQALHLVGASDASDEAIKAWVESAIAVTKVKRDGEDVFVFVEEQNASDKAPEAEEPTIQQDEVVRRIPALTRDEAVARLNGSRLGDAEIEVNIADDSVVGLTVASDSKLVVELEYPVPYFLNLTGFYTFMPVPRHALEKLIDTGENPDLWTRPEHLVCNGPYKMVEWKFRQHMLFERNDSYWNVDASHICRAKKVRALMVESYNTALNMYCTGEIDWLGAQTMVPSEFMDRMRGYKDFDNSRYLGVYFYWFNTSRAPLDDPLVRKALSLAINREQITSYVTRAGQIPMASIVPDGLADYEGLNEPLFDPEAARQALADAGYPGGEGLPPITLIYNTTEQHKQIASAAQQMWKENLGISVSIENQEWKVYLGRLLKVDFQIARMGWIGDYADPNTFLELFASTNGNNHSNWGDEKYDEMLLEANRTVDKKQRLAKLREAEAYVFREQPILPIYVYTKPSMVKPYLGGFFGNDQDHHPWKYFYIKDDWLDGKPNQISEEPMPPVTRMTAGAN